EYWMLNRRGSSTNAAYISSAGSTNSQPMMLSRRTILYGKIRRESAEAAGRLSDVTVDFTVNFEGAGIVTRHSPLLSQLPQVLFLDGLEEPGRVLLTADHLLELGRPALGEDCARRICDEIHRCAGLADHRACSKRLVRDRAVSSGRYHGT